MHDAATVGGRQSAADAPCQRHDLLQAERLSAQALAQVLPLKPLHRQVGLARLVDAVGNIRDDVPMMELRE